MVTSRRKSVTLVFRGFELMAQEVAELVGVEASELGDRGSEVRPGMQRKLVRSYVRFSMFFPNNFELFDMLPALIQHLGGMAHMRLVRKKVMPEFSEIHFDLPVRASDKIQDGYLPESVVADSFRLKAALSFSFF